MTGCINLMRLYKALKRRIVRMAELAFLAVQSRRLLKGNTVQGKPHALPGELIVSLTSYPPRFGALHLTLLSLLGQITRPDKIILWVADKDAELLPREVMDLAHAGLLIHTCADTASYKKIIPVLEQFPDAFIATADDDVYYGPRWLQSLCDAWSGDAREITCHRAHNIKLRPDGLPAPYETWAHKAKGPKVSKLVFATGAGGILYPPHCFFGDVLRQDVFMTDCARADDVWLYWMATLKGCTYSLTDYGADVLNWAGTQDVSLFTENVTNGGNDRQISNMIARYGFPAGN